MADKERGFFESVGNIVKKVGVVEAVVGIFLSSSIFALGIGTAAVGWALEKTTASKMRTKPA